MKRNRTKLRQLIASPVGVVAMVVIVVAGIAGVAAASGSLGTGKTVVRAGAGVPSTAHVGVAGPADAQTLTDPTPSASLSPTARAPVVAPVPTPYVVPAKSTVVPLPGGVPPAAASILGDAQFHNVTFSCPPAPLLFGAGPEVFNCGVASLGGFSGQIVTDCRPSSIGPAFYSCSAPPVDLMGGGSAVIPLTIAPLPTAPPYGAFGAFALTLTLGSVALNPGRPYFIAGQGPPKPANFTLACAVVTQTALPMPMISAIIGSCTVTALDAADIAPTSIYISGIKPPVPGNQVLRVCMTPTAFVVADQNSCYSTALVTPTGGTGTVWFSYSMSAAGSTGATPGPWEFDFAGTQGGAQVRGSATFTLQPDGKVGL